MINPVSEIRWVLCNLPSFILIVLFSQNLYSDSLATSSPEPGSGDMFEEEETSSSNIPSLSVESTVELMTTSTTEVPDASETTMVDQLTTTAAAPFSSPGNGVSSMSVTPASTLPDSTPDPTVSSSVATQSVQSSSATVTTPIVTEPTNMPSPSSMTTGTPQTTTSPETTIEPTTEPLPDIEIYSSCNEMPEGSYQRDECLAFVAEYGRRENGEEFFERYVLINKRTKLDETIANYYEDNDQKPRTVFFLDKRRVSNPYVLGYEIDFESSFALVGIKQGQVRPTVRTSGTFHRRNGREVMIEVDYRCVDDDELELMVIKGIRLNANSRGTVPTYLDTTIATDEQVRIKNAIIVDNQFIDDRSPGGDDHNEHILIRNAVGNVSIVDNQFQNGAIDEKAAEVRCSARRTQICNTRVLFRQNRVIGSGLTSALRLIDIPRFTFESNTVVFGSQSGGNSADAVLEVVYEDLGSCINVDGFIHDNTLTGENEAAYDAVSIVHDPDDVVGMQAGVVYYAANQFGNRRLYLDTTHLPDIELENRIPASLATTSTPTLFSTPSAVPQPTSSMFTEMSSTSTVSGTPGSSMPTAMRPTATVSGASRSSMTMVQSTPPATPPTKAASISSMLPASTTLPFNSSNTNGTAEGVCGVSAGEGAGYGVLSFFTALLGYEAVALGLHSYFNAGAQLASDIAGRWDLVTLGYTLLIKWKLGSGESIGESDTLPLTTIIK